MPTVTILATTSGPPNPPALHDTGAMHFGTAIPGTYAEAHDSPIASALNGTWMVGQDVFAGPQWGLSKVGLIFDTSVIPNVPTAVITQAIITIWTGAKWNIVDFDITVRNGQPTYPHDPVVVGDYAFTHYSGNGGFGNTSHIPVSEAGYVDIPLNALGLSWIVKGGFTKLLLTTNYDIDAIPVRTARFDLYSWMGMLPRLVVTYVDVVLPVVTTDPATEVEETATTLNGALDSDGGEACDCGFEWGLTPAYGNITPTNSKVTGETFSQVIAGLNRSTIYHFRAFATNSAGTGYGADRSFQTLAEIPTVTTNPATNIEAETAILNGTLDDDGGEACDCGFEWGETIALGNTTPTQSGTTGTAFSHGLSGLRGGRTYYFRAFATNSAGTGYGGIRSFTTKVSATVMTLPATHITEHAARLNGMVMDDAGRMGSVRFQWGGTIAYGMETPWIGGHVTGDEFEYNLNGLTEGTGYHFRAQFKSGQIVSGKDLVFHTLVPLGPVTLIPEDLVYLLEASV